METDEQYILAIDGGTQSTKVALFDMNGTEMCSDSVALRPLNLNGLGLAEHPDDDLWDSLRTACQGTLEKFAGDKDAIVGVGLGSIRCCRALLKDDGTLAAPIQNWMDLRLSKPYEHEDDTVRYVTTTTGYLTHRLTGEFRDTRANYVGPWPIDPDMLEWIADDNIFQEFNIPRDMLFDLVDPATVLGHVNSLASEATGLPLGLPVVSTANDKAVEGLGAGITNDGTVLVSLGTYIAAIMFGDGHTVRAENYWCNPGALPGEFLYESNGIRRGMSTVTWIKDLMGEGLVQLAEANHMSPESYLNQLASDEVPPGSEGLYTVPNWLARPGHPHERGMMIGFSGMHKAEHMFRSILEGIAMTMKNHVQAMCDERGIELTNLVVSGGGSNGDLFMQIFADVFGVPAHRNEITGSASLGAAICTAMALGICRNREDAVQSMVRRRDTFNPISENVILYKAINEKVFRDIANSMNDVLQKSHRIFQDE